MCIEELNIIDYKMLFVGMFRSLEFPNKTIFPQHFPSLKLFAGTARSTGRAAAEAFSVACNGPEQRLACRRTGAPFLPDALREGSGGTIH